MKKIIAILSAAALATPAVAGPYVNVENNAGFSGSNFGGHVTDFHIGYESGNDVSSYYVQAGPTIDQHGNHSEYYALTEQARQTTDDLTSFIHELHHDEFPNDWRYQTIVFILDAIIESSEYMDKDDEGWDGFSFNVADQLTSIYTSELAAWFADNASRASYHDDAIELGLIPNDANLSSRLMIAQSMCIEQMASQILNKLEIPNQS